MGPSPLWEGAVLRRGRAAHCKVSGCSAMSCAKTDEPIETPFGLSAFNHVLDGVHTGAAWQIPLNRPYAVAMRPVVKLL